MTNENKKECPRKRDFGICMIKGCGYCDKSEVKNDPTPPDTTEEWVDAVSRQDWFLRIDDRFGETGECIEFIRSLLSSQRETLREKVEKLEMRCESGTEYIKKSDVLQAIKEK